MLIYNHKKEFVGISDKDLKHFQFSNLMELEAETADFADLFVKVPGHIHNFKHVHWLDFISSADSLDENKVIINAKGKNYKAILKLHTLFLQDAPSTPAYGVELTSIRELSQEENEVISGSLAERSIQQTTQQTTPPLATTIPDETEEFFSFENEPDTIEDPYLKEAPLEISTPAPQHKKPQPSEEVEIEFEPEQHNDLITTQQTPSYIDENDPFKDYVYDPEVASNDLGLPIDLVEEFIQDFIAQAYEFKDEMYNSLAEGDMDTLRSTSHKLKGVAANLRIEDAYDALVTINKSDDIEKIQKNLDKFYNVILKKLAGEPIIIQEPTPKQQNDEFDINIQEDDSIELQQTNNEDEDEDDDAPLELSLNLDDTTHLSPQKESFQDTFNDDDKIDLNLNLDLDHEEEIAQENKDLNDDDNDDKIELDLDLDLHEQKQTQTDEPLELKLDLHQDPINENQNFSLEIEEPSKKANESLALELNKIQTPSFSIDKTKIAQQMGIDEETLTSLLQEYTHDVLEGLNNLKQAIIEGDDSSYKKIILRLKGMSDIMFLDAISKDLETLLSDKSADKMAIIESINSKIESINGMV